jgi:undecaprenyl-diphosphatase
VNAKRRLIILAVAVAIGLSSTTDHAGGESIDQSLYRTIHEDWQSPVLDPVMEGASCLGSGEGGLVITALTLAVGDQKAQDTGKLMLYSLVGASAVTAGLKYAVGRDRPDRDTNGRLNSSFPSGHATGAFAMASVAGAKYGSLRIPVYLLASTVALSRVYLGRHYPSDVLAGAGIGLCTGWLIMKNEQFILDFHF